MGYTSRFRSGVDGNALSEFRVSYAYIYEPCSSLTGTVLLRDASSITNELCKRLQCSYKSCIRKTYECDTSTGTARFPDAPEVECAVSATQSNIGAARFSAIFCSMCASVLFCCLGC